MLPLHFAAYFHLTLACQLLALSLHTAACFQLTGIKKATRLGGWLFFLPYTKEATQ